MKGGANYTIDDPSTGVRTGTTITRTPIANHVIPASRIDPVAKALLQFFPQPNISGDATGFRNYVVNAIDKTLAMTSLGGWITT